MKAKDWAAKLAEVPDQRDATLKAFVEEIGVIAKQRGGSLTALEGAVREQRAKWQAICRQCPALAPDLFESLLEAYGKEYQKAEATIQAQTAKRGAPEEADRSLAGRTLIPQGTKRGRASPK